MANLGRGAYEPRVDNAQGFDLADDDEQDDIEEGSRLPLLIVVALLVLAAFAGVVWLAYTQGVQRGRADAPRIIAAEPGPLRVAPANPGGTQTPYTGLKIYQQPAPAGTEDSDAEPSSPPPGLRPSAANTPEPSPAVEPTPSLPPPQKAVAAPPPPAATVHTSTVTASETPKAVTPQPAHQIGGAYVLQIGAYKSQGEADAAWRAFQAKHAIAGGYESDVKQVDLGGKGTWYRLRLGAFPDKQAAAAFCEKLRADGGNCFVAK